MDKTSSTPTVPNRVSGHVIKGRYKRHTEQLDTAKDEQEAIYLVGEYKLAFGPSWKIWFERKKANDA